MNGEPDLPFDVTTWTGYETRHETHPLVADYIDRAESPDMLASLLEMNDTYADKITSRGLNHPRGDFTIDGTVPPNQDTIDAHNEQRTTVEEHLQNETGTLAERILAGEEWREPEPEPNLDEPEGEVDNENDKWARNQITEDFNNDNGNPPPPDDGADEPEPPDDDTPVDLAGNFDDAVNPDDGDDYNFPNEDDIDEGIEEDHEDLTEIEIGDDIELDDVDDDIELEDDENIELPSDDNFEDDIELEDDNEFSQPDNTPDSDIDSPDWSEDYGDSDYGYDDGGYEGGLGSDADGEYRCRKRRK